MAIDNEDEIEQVAASINLSEIAHLKNLVTFLQEVIPVPENSEVYPVECLLGKKVRKKVTHYLVNGKDSRIQLRSLTITSQKEIKLAYNNSK